MKEILLTQNKVALVDDGDFKQLNRFKWFAQKNRNKYYAVRNISTNGKRTIIFMHREIMNASKGIQVDHNNGNGLFNCKENLRLATNQQNQFNREHRLDNKFGIKGVCWHKKNKKFQAQIRVNRKLIYLGLFNILGDADSAYRKAEKKYFGEFVRNAG